MSSEKLLPATNDKNAPIEKIPVSSLSELTSLAQKRATSEPTKGLIICKGKNENEILGENGGTKKYKSDVVQENEKTTEDLLEKDWIFEKLGCSIPLEIIESILLEFKKNKRNPIFLLNFGDPKLKNSCASDQLWKIYFLNSEFTEFLSAKQNLLKLYENSHILEFSTPQTLPDYEKFLKFLQDLQKSTPTQDSNFLLWNTAKIPELSHKISLKPYEICENLYKKKILNKVQIPAGKNWSEICSEYVGGISALTEKEVREHVVNFLSEEIGKNPEVGRIFNKFYCQNAYTSKDSKMTIFEITSEILSKISISDLKFEFDATSKIPIFMADLLKLLDSEENSENLNSEFFKIRKEAIIQAIAKFLTKNAENYCKNLLFEKSDSAKISKICTEVLRFAMIKPNSRKIACAIVENEKNKGIFSIFDENGKTILKSEFCLEPQGAEKMKIKEENLKDIKNNLEKNEIDTIIIGINGKESRILKEVLESSSLKVKNILYGISLVSEQNFDEQILSVAHFYQDSLCEISNILQKYGLENLLNSLRIDFSGLNSKKIYNFIYSILSTEISKIGYDLNKIISNEHFQGILHFLGISTDSIEKLRKCQNLPMKNREEFMKNSAILQSEYENFAEFVSLKNESMSKIKFVDNRTEIDINEKDLEKFFKIETIKSQQISKMEDIKSNSTKIEITHPKFFHGLLKDAENELSAKNIGDYFFCTNAENTGILAIFKSNNAKSSIGKFDIIEDKNTKKYQINGEFYENFDEIERQAIIPMMNYVKEVTSFRKFYPAETFEFVDSHLKKDQERFPDLISYCFAILSNEPTKILLAYYPSKDQLVKESFYVNEQGYWFHGQYFTNIGTLVAFFKQHCMDSEYKNFLQYGEKAPPAKKTEQKTQSNDSWGSTPAKAQDSFKVEIKEQNAAKPAENDPWSAPKESDWGTPAPSNENKDSWGANSSGSNDRGNRRGRGRGDFGDSRGGRRPMTCFNCGQEGHMSRECTQERKPRGDRGDRGGRGFRGGRRGDFRGGDRRGGDHSENSNFSSGGGWGSEDRKSDYKSFNTSEKSNDGWGSSNTNTNTASTSNGWGSSDNNQKPATDSWGSSDNNPKPSSDTWGSSENTSTKPASDSWGSSDNSKPATTDSWGSSSNNNESGGWGISESRPRNDFGGEDRGRGRGRGGFRGGDRGDRGRGGRGRGCFNCGQEGHMARECPNKDASGGGRRGDFRGGRRGDWRGSDRGGRRGRGNFESGNSSNSSGGWGSSDSAGWGESKPSESSGNGWGNDSAKPASNDGWGSSKNETTEKPSENQSSSW